MRIYFYISIFLLLIPSIAMAAPVIFDSPDTDQSLFYLSEIFGNAGNLLATLKFGETPLPDFYRVFNIAILSLGTIIVTYTSILSVVQTAKEGEILGRKWSSVWVPMRSFAGLGMLIPTASGYCSAQLLMLWAITQGVGAANELWDVILDNYEAGYGFNIPAPLMNIDQAGDTLMKAAICRAYANENKKDFGINKNKSVDMYYDPRNQRRLYIGVQDGGAKKRVCGAITFDPAPETISTQQKEQLLRLQKDAYLLAFQSLEFAAREAITSPCSDAECPVNDSGDEDTPTTQYWDEKKAVSRARAIISDYYNQIRQLDYLSFDSTRNSVGKDARADGWMYAGSYYAQLVKGTSGVSVAIDRVPAVTADSRATRYTEDNIPEEPRDAYQFIAENYINFTEDSTGITGSALAVPARGGAPGMPLIMGMVFGDVFKGATEFFFEFLNESVTISGPGGIERSDPLLSMNAAGMTLLSIVENAYIIGLVLSASLIITSHIFDGQQPAGWPIALIVKLILPLITFFMAMLLAPAALLGIYMPLVPYMQFTFGVITWFILTIEAVTAAPIIALGLSMPSQDQWGKASHAILLTLNLFMRPALMVLGFAFGARLVMIGADLVNQSFAVTLAGQTGELGIFAICGVLMLYSGLMVLIVNEAFGLINVLPDRVIRWIGGQPESTRAEHMQQGAKEQFDKGVEKSKEIGVGAAKWLGQKGSELLDQKKEKSSSELKEDGQAESSDQNSSDTNTDSSNESNDNSNNNDTSNTSSGTTGERK